MEIFKYYKEYWTGDSRDGELVDGDGYNYYKINEYGMIVEACEYYEREDGVEVISPLPEMLKVNWLKDLGFEDYETLDEVSSKEFGRIYSALSKS